jgi:hypothetical protein
MPGILILISLGWLCAGGNLVVQPVNVPSRSLLVLVCCTGVPPLLLYAMSAVSVNTFTARYYLSAYPALAILLSLLLLQLAEARTRLFLAVSFAIGSVLVQWGYTPFPSPDKDREASMILNREIGSETTPVLYQSGFVEARSLKRLNNPVTLGFIQAPLHAYPVRGEIATLPFTPNDLIDLRESLLNKVTRNNDRFFLYSREEWQRFMKARYSERWQAISHHPMVTEFRRR